MTETGPLFLDCETKDGRLRMTTLAPALETLLSILQGRHIDYTEEHIKDSDPPEEDGE